MTRPRLFPVKPIYLGHVILTLLVTRPGLAAEDSLVASVRRIDPLNGELVPVDSERVIPGKIYNHFSQRHGRYVWAFAEQGGRFSYPLGIGSTEMPGNFDLVTSQRQTKELVEAAAGPWAEKSRLQGKQIMLRLGADERWQIVRGRSIRSHYDIDSERRWEWHGNRRVAVLHINGYRWQYSGGRYVSANAWLVSSDQHAARCNGTNCRKNAYR